MEIGSIVLIDDVHHIVIRTRNEQIEKIEPLEKYISRSVLMDYRGEYRTIREIIEIHCNDYLNAHRGEL